MFLFDTGLFQRMLGLNIADILLANDFKTVNRGALAEFFIGLEIVKASSCYFKSCRGGKQRIEN